MNQLTQEQLENKITDFNKIYKVGDKVEVRQFRDDDSELFIDKIRYEATIMGGHTAMTWLVDKGSYDLDFVKRKLP